MHGFPAALTSFVGRAAVVDEIADQLGRDRLVTVTGPGGAGKTRLAGEVAKRVAGRFADGVWLAELAAVGDPAQGGRRWAAAALGVRDLPSAAAADALASALARRQLLLVLDNCEQVIGAAAGAVRQATARRRRCPGAGHQPGAAADSRGGAVPAGAADAAYPDDPADPDESEAVAVRATGPAGLMRAPRWTVKPRRSWRGWWRGWTGCRWRSSSRPRGSRRWAWRLLGRIDDRLTLLEAGGRLAAARHRSLAATVEWSYRLLDERGRRVFRAVSVFRGGSRWRGPRHRVDGASPAVLHLVDCSLLARPRAGPDGRSRMGCSRRCGPTGRGCWQRPERVTPLRPRWRGTRCGWPRTPWRG